MLPFWEIAIGLPLALCWDWMQQHGTTNFQWYLSYLYKLSVFDPQSNKFGNTHEHPFIKWNTYKHGQVWKLPKVTSSEVKWPKYSRSLLLQQCLLSHSLYLCLFKISLWLKKKDKREKEELGWRKSQLERSHLNKMAYRSKQKMLKKIHQNHSMWGRKVRKSRLFLWL